jgi:ribosomal protein L20
MARSVNSVASRARRKRILKQAKGYFGRRKNVWTVAKNAVEKAMQYAYRDRKQKKREISVHFGLCVLMQEPDYTDLAILSSWVN